MRTRSISIVPNASSLAVADTPVGGTTLLGAMSFEARQRDLTRTDIKHLSM
ncbi:hypothetical protein [Ktedonospora formicarum]|uniref:hypothetical protein n=1 Tax=Ktedonospora formicarum TaxID=2778364 RepID=UPI001C689984|nr:hypothetical protein [Ktedonospora formicarum]